MKPKVFSLLAMLVGFVGVLFTSCDKGLEPVIDETPPQNSIVLGSFPSDKVFTERDLKDNIIKYAIGSTQKNAIVPLVFDDQGKLYTREKMNGDLNGKNVTCVFTDLHTFYSVTKMSEAKEKYSKALNLFGKRVWLFDPYQLKYTDEQSRKISKNLSRLRTSSTINLRDIDIADIFYEDDTWQSYFTGHVAGVSNIVNAVSGEVSLSTAMQYITVSEAYPPVVYTRQMSEWWSSPDDMYLLKYTGSITQSQRIAISRFWASKTGEWYYFSGLDSNSGWYCSKLMWRGYNDILGINIDSDGGYWCFPRDIYNSSYFQARYLTQ